MKLGYLRARPNGDFVVGWMVDTPAIKSINSAIKMDG